MKSNVIIFFVLLAVICIGGIIADKKIGSLKNQLEDALTTSATPDTIQITLAQTDTIFVSYADTVEIIDADTIMRNDTIFIYTNNKHLVDFVQTPLFDLKLDVWTANEQFNYDFRYNPITLRLVFVNKYDLRSGFDVTASPAVNNITVDWGDYTPIKLPKKPKGISLAIGGGYGDSKEVSLIGILTFKRNNFGILYRNGTKDYFYARTLFAF